MIIKCKDILDLLSEFFDDELDMEEEEFLFDHLYQCNRCLQIYNSYRQMLDLFHLLKPVKLEQERKKEFHKWLHVEIKQIVIKRKYKKL
jgi:hypothetical protein